MSIPPAPIAAMPDLVFLRPPITSKLALALHRAVLLTLVWQAPAEAEAADDQPPDEPQEPRTENEAAAQILFKAGRNAMESKDYDLACRKFTESNRVDPAPGTLLNLGNCEEKRGRIASSWERYTEAMNLLDEQDKRRDFARSKAESLEPRVPRLTVTLSEDTPSNTRVALNGESIEHELGAPVRLDPGQVVIVAEAAGYHRKVYEIEMSAGDNEQLSVGVTERLRTGTPAFAAPEPKDAVGTGDAPTLGYVFGGTGIVLGAAGAAFGVLTYQQYQIVADHCDVDAQLCYDAAGQDAAKTGADYELLAYVLGGAGLASLSLGTYLLLSHEDEGETRGARVALSLVPGGLSVSGGF